MRLAGYRRKTKRGHHASGGFRFPTDLVLPEYGKTGWLSDERPLSSIPFRDVDPQHRLRSVALCPQVLLDFSQKLFHSFPFYFLDGHAIYPGTSTISAYFIPGPPQNIRPENAVI